MGVDEKEYKILTVDQFKRVVKQLPEVRSQMKELPTIIKAASPERVKEVLDQDFYWAQVYELSFPEQMALLFCALGKAKKLLEVAQTEDPQETPSSSGWKRIRTMSGSARKEGSSRKSTSSD